VVSGRGAHDWRAVRQTTVEEGDRQEYHGLSRCPCLPNKGVQATANSVRSCVAPALRRA
jgi:hypothetical protein